MGYSAVTVGWAFYEFNEAFVETEQYEHAQIILEHFAEYFRKCVIWTDESKTTPLAFAYQVGDGGEANDHGYWGPPEDQHAGHPASRGHIRNGRFTNLTAERPGTDQVGIAAAVLASNYVNFRNSEDLRVAKILYEWAMNSEHKGLSTGSTPFYESTKWRDKLALTAEWLFIATGEQRYREESTVLVNEANWQNHTTWPMDWDGVWPQVNAMRGDWNTVRTNMEVVNPADSSYLAVSSWGSARYNCGFQMLGLLHDKHVTEGAHVNRYSSWADGQMRFLLGDNPLGNTYIIGYNENSRNRQPHHRAASGFPAEDNWALFNANAPVRNFLIGGLIGGPAQDGSWMDVLERWTYTEVATDYNAAFVGAAAGLYLRFDGSKTANLDTSIEGVRDTHIFPRGCDCNEDNCRKCNPCTCNTCGCFDCFRNGMCNRAECDLCNPICENCNNRDCICIPVIIRLDAKEHGPNSWLERSGTASVTRDGAHSVVISDNNSSWIQELNITAAGLPQGVTITLNSVMLNTTEVTHNITTPLSSGNPTAIFWEAWAWQGGKNITGGHAQGGPQNEQLGLDGAPNITRITVNFTVSGMGGVPVSTTPPVTTTTESTTTTIETPMTSPTTTVSVTTTPEATASPPTVTSPETTTTEVPERECCDSDCLIGDVDNNGIVNINDALEILKFLANIEGNLIDTDETALRHSLILPASKESIGGGKPTILDVLEILKYLAGIPSEII
jgi:hypothetical protein